MRIIPAATLAATLLAALVALPGTAHAQREARINGQKLAGLCGSRDKVALEACTAYIDGIADSVAFYQRLRPKDGSKGAALPDYICIPGATTGVQLRETVVAWFRTRPERANQQASGIVLNALNDTYRCPGETPRAQTPAEPPK